MTTDFTNTFETNGYCVEYTARCYAKAIPQSDYEYDDCFVDEIKTIAVWLYKSGKELSAKEIKDGGFEKLAEADAMSNSDNWEFSADDFVEDFIDDDVD